MKVCSDEGSVMMIMSMIIIMNMMMAAMRMILIMIVMTNIHFLHEFFSLSQISMMSKLGISVRKSVVLLFKEILLHQPNHPSYTDLCLSLLERVSMLKEEDTVKDIIKSIFRQIWFLPPTTQSLSSSSIVKVEVIVPNNNAVSLNKRGQRSSESIIIKDEKREGHAIADGGTPSVDRKHRGGGGGDSDGCVVTTQRISRSNSRSSSSSHIEDNSDDRNNNINSNNNNNDKQSYDHHHQQLQLQPQLPHLQRQISPISIMTDTLSMVSDGITEGGGALNTCTSSKASEENTEMMTTLKTVSVSSIIKVDSKRSNYDDNINDNVNNHNKDNDNIHNKINVRDTRNNYNDDDDVKVFTHIESTAFRLIEIVSLNSTANEWLITLLRDLLHGSSEGDDKQGQMVARRLMSFKHCEKLVSCLIDLLIRAEEGDRCVIAHLITRDRKTPLFIGKRLRWMR